MEAATLTCPQCGGPLPRQALWRSVVCKYCAAEVTRSESVVSRAGFRQAYQRAHAAPGGNATVACGASQYRILKPIGVGATAQLLLAERTGPARERVVLKVAHAGVAEGHLAKEREVLDALQADSSSGAAYFTQQLPQLAGHGTTGDGRPALVLRSPAGYWGSLACVRDNHPAGIDPRHAVWMWRRALGVLAHVHACGWVHGRLSPDHWLVNPADHGILLIGWAGARRTGGGAAQPAERARDLVQTAWTIRMMLAAGDGEPAIPASTPQPLASLLARASEDAAWCGATGAAGLDETLVSAAHEAFGEPRFIDFNPSPATDRRG